MGNWATIHGPRFGDNHCAKAYSIREKINEALARMDSSERMGRLCRIDERNYRELYRSW